jgi:hypothetical protein
MSDMAIVIARTEGGLSAALEGSDYELISGSERQFSSLTTYSDASAVVWGHIDTDDSGWVAFAERGGG